MPDVVQMFGHLPVYTTNIPKEADNFRKRFIETAKERDGSINPVKTISASSKEASTWVKQKATELGAEIVKITTVNKDYLYKDRELSHTHCICIAIHMNFDEMKLAPSPEAFVEVLRVYDVVGRTAVNLAKQMRSLGYSARAHTVRGEDIIMIPHAVQAGVGELGKHGSIITPEFGSCIRLGAVTTDLPLMTDDPPTLGFDDFCQSCSLCVRHCPGDAIKADKEIVRGEVRWIVNTEKCAPYFAANWGCEICLKVCALNSKASDHIIKQAFLETIRKLPDHKSREDSVTMLLERWKETGLEPSVKPPNKI